MMGEITAAAQAAIDEAVDKGLLPDDDSIIRVWENMARRGLPVEFSLELMGAQRGIPIAAAASYDDGDAELDPEFRRSTRRRHPGKRADVPGSRPLLRSAGTMPTRKTTGRRCTAEREVPAMSGSNAGENWAGYTRAENAPGEDGKQVDKSLRSAWPPGTFDKAAGPGHQEQSSRQLVYPGEGQGKKKRTPKKAKPS